VITSRVLLFKDRHAIFLIFTFSFLFFVLQHFFMDAEMKECVDPVTDEDVRCGAGTKGMIFFSPNILQTPPPSKILKLQTFLNSFVLLNSFNPFFLQSL
jgi:hypothetical protein